MTPEAKVIHSFLKLAKEKNWQVRKCSWEGRRGAPDRFVLGDGYHFWVEFKREGAKLQQHQEREIKRMKKAGCEVFLLDSQKAVEEFFND